MTTERRIRLRRGTTAEWNLVNPVLKEGEIVWDETAKKFKVGDGILNWASIPYVGADEKVGVLTYIGTVQPTDSQYVWWDTTGGDLTLWIEDGS